MKLIILKTNLVDALTVVERAVSENSSLPILKHVLIKAFAGKITLIGTNLELAVECFVSGKVVEEGETTAPFSLLNSIVKNLSAERVSLEEEGGKITVTTDNYQAVLQGQDAAEFPIIPSVQESAHRLAFPTELFRGALQEVIVAAQYSDIRPEISGVYFEYADREITLAATDGFRLAERKIGLPDAGTPGEKLSAIIPLKTAAEVLKMFKGSETMEVFLEPNQILFASASEKTISRVIDGSFPEYHAVIPHNPPHEVVVDRSEFINAIRLASSFSGRGNDITVRVGDSKRVLEIYSADNTLGESSYKIPVKFKGEAFSVIFNWRYLLDGLRVFSGNEITLGVTSSDRAALLHSTKEPQLIYVVMPIKG